MWKRTAGRLSPAGCRCSAPFGYDTDHRTGSVFLAVLREPHGAELEDAIRGLAHLRDGGQLERSHGISPGDRLHLRVLHSSGG